MQYNAVPWKVLSPLLCFSHHSLITDTENRENVGEGWHSKSSPYLPVPRAQQFFLVLTFTQDDAWASQPHSITLPNYGNPGLPAMGNLIKVLGKDLENCPHFFLDFE
ncbi:protein FAM49A-like isoform X1, partial [Clarias magur]